MQDDAYTIITAEEASSMIVPDIEWIVEGFLPLGFKAILSGTTGSNKSYASMELGMRVADANEDGSSEFLHYKIQMNVDVLMILFQQQNMVKKQVVVQSVALGVIQFIII